MKPGQIARLRAALDALPSGPWEVWTSNSFRRISRVGGGDGDVLHGTIQRADGHPDLNMTADELRALCELRNCAADIVGVV